MEKQQVSKTDGKKLLIFLHIFFNGNQTEIMKELLENNYHFVKKDINKFFRNNKVKLRDYITILDKSYDISKMDTENMVYVIKK